VVALCCILSGFGVQHAIIYMPNIHEIAPLETFRKEIIPVMVEM